MKLAIEVDIPGVVRQIIWDDDAVVEVFDQLLELPVSEFDTIDNWADFRYYVNEAKMKYHTSVPEAR